MYMHINPYLPFLYMNMYIYICMYTYIHMNIFKCIHIYPYINMYIHIYIYIGQNPRGVESAMAKTIISKFYIFTDISSDLPEKNKNNEDYDDDNDDGNSNIHEYDLRMVDMNVFGYICKMSGK
jgi:hypothetical protein